MYLGIARAWCGYGEHGEHALKEFALCCYTHSLGVCIDAQFVEDRGEVLGDGAFGNEELPANSLAGEALRHQSQHHTLA